MTTAAREVTANISELVWATNPRHDTLESSIAYLREHAARQFEPASINAAFDFPQTIPALRVSAMFRRNTAMIVKEAINNLLKHSGARNASLKVEVTDTFLTIALVDDGRGFDPAKPRHTRSGMGNMRQRVEDLQGALKMDAAPGAGTKIRIRIPIPRAGSQLPT
jgi:signal transduction histidine kinase